MGRETRVFRQEQNSHALNDLWAQNHQPEVVTRGSVQFHCQKPSLNSLQKTLQTKQLPRARCLQGLWSWVQVFEGRSLKGWDEGVDLTSIAQNLRCATLVPTKREGQIFRGVQFLDK